MTISKKTTKKEEASEEKKKKPASAKKAAPKKTAVKTEKKPVVKKTAEKKPAAKKPTVKKTAAKKEAVVKTEQKITQPAVEVKPEVKAEIKVEPKVEVKTEPKPEPRVEVKPEVEQVVVQPAPAAQASLAPEAKPVVAAPKPAPAPTAPAQAKPAEKVIKIVGAPTVKELAEKMNFRINDFIKKLMGLGIFATINQRLEPDMIELVLSECGFKAEMSEEFAKDSVSDKAESEDKPEDLKPRSPVVTIMGHVDHGKTSLLDAIRQSNVAEGEHGAITQHIGAYRVKTPRGAITFLDTPGHEAFTAMRARGAQATDIVILVVSATDGIMPQTLEAIDHAKAAAAPIIVAVNKIDLPGANPDKIKQDLANRGLVPEEWQGNTIFVEISAKKRINIDKLLEMVSLQAEMMELKANPSRLGVGVILESKRDNKRGVVATVLVQKGTMKVGDPFVVGTAFGRIRALIDENGQRLQNIGPSVPAEVLGINGEPPHVGDTLVIAESDKEARYVADKRKLAHKEDAFAHKKHVSLMNLSKEGGAEIKKLALILKADVQGSIEAIKDALLKIPSEEVEVSIVHSGAGNINNGDILLAKASDAVVIGFNVDTDDSAQTEAQKDGIEIRTYHIIFELLEDIKAAMEGLLAPDIVEVNTGRATVRQVFNLSSGIVAGSLVDSGKITRGSEAKVIRAGEVVWTGRIGGLKRFKDDVKEVEHGYECGILLDGFKQIKEGDIVETFRKDSITRRISA